ncbi:MAG: rhodanese-like domain-containing protein [Proteobacteria bacterium]|jgi:rhodanese-related sulfurtransferase|nr:rhodanese-like domain-containing protein [Pseudomonadota bacterium]
MLEQFFIENLVLFLALFIVIGLFFALPSIASIGGSSGVSALQLPQLQRSDHMIIDVSTNAEFNKGHLPGALNLPLEELQKDTSKINKHKGKNLILTCANGNKSIAAGKYLKKQGFEQVHHLNGGLIAWERENLPVAS